MLDKCHKGTNSLPKSLKIVTLYFYLQVCIRLDIIFKGKRSISVLMEI